MAIGFTAVIVGYQGNSTVGAGCEERSTEIFFLLLLGGRYSCLVKEIFLNKTKLGKGGKLLASTDRSKDRNYQKRLQKDD